MSTQINAFITVRSSSKRLPQKCFLPFGEIDILTHVIRRAIFFKFRPIVCTTDLPEDDKVVEIAIREGVDFYRGASANKLKRWADCAEFFKIQSFHTIDADDPFFDPLEVERSMDLLHSVGLDMVMPTKSSSDGSATVGFSLTAGIVGCAVVGIPENEDTEMMWDFLSRVKSIKAVELPEPQYAQPKIRLTLDYQEDYWILNFIYRLLGTYAERRKIDDLFFANPDLYKINWFRNSEWQQAQISKINSHTHNNR